MSNRLLAPLEGWILHDWFGFLFLLPFLFLWAIHDALGLSDAMGGGTPMADVSFSFNILLILVFFAGIGLYVTHAILLAVRGGGWRRLAAKALALIVYWAVTIIAN